MVMPTAEGPISNTLEKLGGQFSKGTSFQTKFVDGNEAESLAQIHYNIVAIDVDDDGQVRRDDVSLADFNDARPFLMLNLDWPNGYDIDIVADSAGLNHGYIVEAYFEMEVNNDDSSNCLTDVYSGIDIAKPAEVQRAWENIIGLVLKELASNGNIAIRQITEVSLWRGDEKQLASLGDYVAATCKISIGARI